MTRRRIFWVLTALWLVFIWGHSLMPAAASKAESGHLLRILQQVLPFLTDHSIRKAAHFTEYFILGALLFGAVSGGRIRSFSFPVLFGVLAALADETVQLFSDGRSGQISDVWLDLAGFLLAYLLCMLLFHKRTRTE